MRDFIKSFFSFGFATSIEKLMAFLLLPIYTRFFTTADFGVIDLIQVIVGIFAVFAVLQLETALQRYYYEFEGDNRKELVSTIIHIIITLSLFVSFLLFIFSDQVSVLLFENIDYSLFVKLGALQIPFINFSMLSFVVLRYEKRNIRFVSLIIIKVLITIVLILLLVVWLKKGVYGVILANLIGLSISSVFLFISIKSTLSFKLSFKYLNQSIKYALPQFPARLGSVLLSYGNRFFMIGYLSISAIGIYSLSLKLASSVQLVYSAFVMAWAPFMFSQFKIPGHKLIFAKVLNLAGAPVFFLVAIISLFSKEIVQLIASNEFIDAHHYLGGLCLYFSLYIFKEIVDIGPKYKEQTKYLTLTFFISVIINLGTLYFLTKEIGLYGVVYSMIITNTSLFFISWFVSNKLYYIPFNVIQFLILALPAYGISIASMYMQVNITSKILIFILLSIFYVLFFYKSYKNFNIKPSISQLPE